MPIYGAELPPHLQAQAQQDNASSSDDETGPAVRPKSHKRKSPSPHCSPDKRRRVVGPAPPPAPLTERPLSPPHTRPTQSDSDSDSDSDIGPAPPPINQQATSTVPAVTPTASTGPAAPSARDEWMLAPPKPDDASRMDPSRQRAKGFKTGPGATSVASKEIDAAWTETPEQTRRRLADEVLGERTTGGAGVPSSGSAGAADEVKRRLKRDRDEKIAREIQAGRGKSLYETHQSKSRVEEDDPSRRAFDREKDMGLGGGVVGQNQRRSALRDGGGFTDKFSGGGFL